MRINRRQNRRLLEMRANSTLDPTQGEFASDRIAREIKSSGANKRPKVHSTRVSINLDNRVSSGATRTNTDGKVCTSRAASTIIVDQKDGLNLRLRQKVSRNRYRDNSKTV